SFLGRPMGDITNVRQEMYRRGFSVLPVEGKIPHIEQWQKLSANTDAIALWPKLYSSHTNTGAHTKYTPAIDIDLLNPEAAEAVDDLACSRFEEHGIIARRVGLWPKRALLFKTNAPFKKLTLKLIAPNGKGEKIEILGDGEQVVVHGIHPETKKPYTWPSGTPWHDFCAQDLPDIDETMAREFLRDAAELLTTEYGYKLQEAPRPPQTNGGGGGPPAGAHWGKSFFNIASAAGPHRENVD